MKRQVSLFGFLKLEERQERIDDPSSNGHSEGSTRIRIEDSCSSITEIENEFTLSTLK